MKQLRKNIRKLNILLSSYIFFGLLIFPQFIFAQSHNHWTRNFNEESSLLSGAVVGGGAGPSAIYYNPASIAEITESKLSFNASLFLVNFLTVKNALGDGVDFNYTRTVIQPRFFSYMIQPKKHPEFSFEFAFLNKENYRLDIAESVDQNLDVLTNLPGIERYYAFFQYRNIYRDDWLGVGGSWKINPSLFVGASMFVSVKSMEYSYTLDIEAFPLDSVFINEEYVPFYSASYQEMEYVKYNDYRLVWKAGFLYKKEGFSVGVNVTTPSLGGIYSDGKKSMRKQKQSNITFPETGEPLPNYVVVDYKDKKDVSVNARSPMSVACGFTYYIPGGTKILYTTLEYFNGLDTYRLVQADENPTLASGSTFKNIDFQEWLTYVSGYIPVINAALGYQWTLKEDLLLLAGFRTDFNYRKNFDFSPFTKNHAIKGLDVDNYHLTSGLSWNIKGQDLMTGLQYTIGRQRNQQQFANLTDPVEYNTAVNTPLIGIPENTMTILSNSLSFYFGATFNFGGAKKD